MIESIDDLRREGLEYFAPLLVKGDWYLVGSRTTGHSDALSDWDTILIVDSENVGSPPQEIIDEAFGITRPALHGRPTLDFHIAWRSVTAIDLDVLTPIQAHRRSEDLSGWAHELAHAELLHRGTGAGETYRFMLAASFDAAVPTLASQAYDRYRLGRNQAVSALARPDAAVQAVLTGECAVAAAQTWFLAAGKPAPGSKWLLPALDQALGGAELASLLRTALGVVGAESADQRFDAHLAIWQLLDRRCEHHGLAID